MKLAMSNIAWSPEEAGTAYGLLKEYGFHGLEFAPGLLFPEEPDPCAPGQDAIEKVISELSQYDLVPVSMQSLHFGVSGAVLFGTQDERSTFMHSIQCAAQLAERMSFSNLVIGSPKSRIVPDDMTGEEASEVARAAFISLADKVEATGQVLAIEPNPAAYGTNFLTTVDAVCDFVARCDHPAITINFDTGALHMNDEADKAVLLFQRALPKVSHIHISEAWLAPVPSERVWLEGFARMVKESNFQGWVSIEMKRPDDDPLQKIEAALAAVSAAFTS